MNIDKEIEKYQTKRNKLTDGLVAKLKGYAGICQSNVADINTTVTNLNERKEEHIKEIQKATLQLNALSGDK